MADTTNPTPGAPPETRDGPPTGEPAPPFAAPSTTHRTLDLERFVGRVPVALVFCHGVEDPTAVVVELDRLHHRFGEARVQLLAVVDRTIGDAVERSRQAGTSLPVLPDPAGRLADDYSVDPSPDHLTVVAVDVEGDVVGTSHWPVVDVDPAEVLALFGSGRASSPIV